MTTYKSDPSKHKPEFDDYGRGKERFNGDSIPRKVRENLINPRTPQGNRNLLHHVKTGTHLFPHSPLIRAYGCTVCPWKNGHGCPHGFVGKEKHAQGYCIDRIVHVKNLLDALGGPGAMKLKQVEQFMGYDEKATLLQEEMMLAKEDNDLKSYDKAFNKWTILTSKMDDMMKSVRKQDEGTKLSIDNPLDKLRGVIDVTPEEVKDLNIEDL